MEAERPADGYYMQHSVVDWTLEQLFSYNFSHQAALVTAVKRLYLTGVDYGRPTELIPRLTEVCLCVCVMCMCLYRTRVWLYVCHC